MRTRSHSCARFGAATGIGRRKHIVKAYIDEMPIMAAARRFVLCLRNTGYEVSLERRTIYQVLPDRAAAAHNDALRYRPRTTSSRSYSTSLGPDRTRNRYVPGARGANSASNVSPTHNDRCARSTVACARGRS